VLWTELIAATSAWLIQLFDHQVLANGVIIQSANFGVAIRPGCIRGLSFSSKNSIRGLSVFALYRTFFYKSERFKLVKKLEPRIDFSFRGESFFKEKTFASKGMDEITQSKSKPDLAGSKENLPGQNQVWSRP